MAHPLVWVGQELEILALTHMLLILHSESYTHGLSAYVGAGIIYLPYLVHHVQSLAHPDLLVLSQRWTQHLDLHCWRLLLDLTHLNQVMRLHT